MFVGLAVLLVWTLWVLVNLGGFGLRVLLGLVCVWVGLIADWLGFGLGFLVVSVLVLVI